MNRLLPAITLFCLITYGTRAQTIGMEFPAFAGKTYELILFQGDRQVKVVQDTIPAGGKFALTIPADYAPYTGMCRWLITNTKEGGGLDMTIPGHGFSVSCMADKPGLDNIVYKGYDPVNRLNRLYAAQQTIVDKSQTMVRAAQLYGKKSALTAVFEKEATAQQTAFARFSLTLKKDPDYTARFLPIVSLTRGIGPRLSADRTEEAKATARFIANELDMNALYTSGHWEAVLAAWAQIETSIVNKDEEMLAGFNAISNRLKNAGQYTDFVKSVTKVLTQMGKDQQIDLLTPLVVRSGKITDYSGVLSVYKSVGVGSQAPALVLTAHQGAVSDHNHETTTIPSSELATKPYDKTLLVFYESGCGPCENLLQQLPGNYELLKSKGTRIISIAADTDEKTFVGTAEKLPWKDDAYCDFDGKKGVNFRNYGVTGTPTLILLEESGKVALKTALLSDVIAKINQRM